MPPRHINLVNPIFIERVGGWLLVPEITDKLNTFSESPSHCGMSQCYWVRKLELNSRYRLTIC